MFDTGAGSQTPWVVRILLRAGLKDRKQAETILLLFAGICVAFTVFTLIPRKTLPPQNDVQQNPNYEPTRTQ